MCEAQKARGKVKHPVLRLPRRNGNNARRRWFKKCAVAQAARSQGVAPGMAPPVVLGALAAPENLICYWNRAVNVRVFMLRRRFPLIAPKPPPGGLAIAPRCEVACRGGPWRRFPCGTMFK
jgi:hypothetical protein